MIINRKGEIGENLILNNMEQGKKIIINNENNEEKEFYILATFDIAQRDKSYVLYTDYSKTVEGKIKIYASIYETRE